MNAVQHKTRIHISGALFLTLCHLLIFANSAQAVDVDFGLWFEQDAIPFKSQTITLFVDSQEKKLELKNFMKSSSVLIPQIGYYSEIENFRSCPDTIGYANVCELATPLFRKIHNKKGSQLFLQKNKLKDELDELKEEFHQEPQEGKLEMTAENKLRVTKKSSSGTNLDVDASLEKIIQDIKDKKSKVELVATKIEPAISTDNISELGINELIGNGQSDFRGSSKNRIHNINVAVEKFQGYLLKPGEEFSFTTILGPVESWTGYKEELVIKDNKTIPEFGGGVCQVSTTMFRVALNAGLKITERQNHAYPVQYYAPQGTDATIYIPKPDLRFVNDTPGHILIQARINGSILIFDMFGTSDGRKVELEGPFVTERTADGKLKTVLYQVINDAEGNLLRKDTFKSFYDNPAKYHEPEYTSKPDDWSNKQWDVYKVQHGL